jgi:hypothetical protein
VAVAARAGVIASDHQVCAAVVAADDTVKKGLAWAREPHGKGQKRQLHFAGGQQGQHCLVATQAGEGVHVAVAGRAHHWVQQQPGVGLAHGPAAQLEVSEVHRVARLERDYARPSSPLDLVAQLARRRPQCAGGLARWQLHSLDAPAET